MVVFSTEVLVVHSLDNDGRVSSKIRQNENAVFILPRISTPRYVPHVCIATQYGDRRVRIVS